MEQIRHTMTESKESNIYKSRNTKSLEGKLQPQEANLSQGNTKTQRINNLRATIQKNHTHTHTDALPK